MFSTFAWNRYLIYKWKRWKKNNLPPILHYHVHRTCPVRLSPLPVTLVGTSSLALTIAMLLYYLLLHMRVCMHEQWASSVSRSSAYSASWTNVSADGKPLDLRLLTSPSENFTELPWPPATIVQTPRRKVGKQKYSFCALVRRILHGVCETSSVPRCRGRV